jgi:histone H3/H4/flagellar biosynthesis regulator FlaF
MSSSPSSSSSSPPPFKRLRSNCQNSYCCGAYNRSRNYEEEDLRSDNDQNKKNKEITVITASLGEVQARLSNLHEEMACDGLVEKALSDPMSRRTLLARLSDVAQLARLGEIARQDKSFRKAFLTVAHELEDIMESDEDEKEEEEQVEDDTKSENNSEDGSDYISRKRERNHQLAVPDSWGDSWDEDDEDWDSSEWSSDDIERSNNDDKQEVAATTLPTSSSSAVIMDQSHSANRKKKLEIEPDTEEEGDDTDLQILEESKQHLQQIDKEIEIPVLTETASREEVEDLWEAIEDEIDKNDEQIDQERRAIHILTGSLNILRDFNGVQQNSSEEETANFIREAETLLHYLKLDHKFVPLKAIRGKIKEIKVRIDKITANDPIRTERRQELEAMYEIHTEQRCTDLVFDKFAFQSLCMEAVRGHYFDYRATETAMEVLQIAAEAYLVELFSKAERFAKHGHRTFVTIDDFKLFRFVRDEKDEMK